MLRKGAGQGHLFPDAVQAVLVRVSLGREGIVSLVVGFMYKE